MNIGRDRWSSKTAFILAAIGSAIGLGNIWRFPYVCAKFGGGAFLFAYFVALFTAGIPLLILEFGMGQKSQKAAPGAFKYIDKKDEFIGWWAAIIGFALVTYYAVIIAWILIYFISSFHLGWGDNPKAYFNNFVLNKLNIDGAADAIYNFSGISLKLIFALIASWILIVASIWKGAKTVSKVVYITVIVPWVILLLFVYKGVTLPGAVDGIKVYLTPDFTQLGNPELWINAFSQVFFSLSVGFAIMIAYASFRDKKADIVKNAFIIGLADSATAFVGGFAVFGTLGYYAHILKKPVAAVMGEFQGFGLVFTTYPTIINKFAESIGKVPAIIFGILFFVMLFTLAIDSAFSLVEAVAASARDKWNLSHRKVNIGIALLCLVCGLVFITRTGLYWLDIVDYYVFSYGIITICIIESILIGYKYKASRMREYINEVSEMKVGVWWDICVKYITPAVLIILLFLNVKKGFNEPYGGYLGSANFLGGWLLIILFPIFAILLMRSKDLNKLFSNTIKFILVLLGYAFLGYILNKVIGLPFKVVVGLFLPTTILFGGIAYCLLHKPEEKSGCRCGCGGEQATDNTDDVPECSNSDK